MPALVDLVLRDATVADIDPITRIVASSPDDAADWTYPELRHQAKAVRRLHARAFAGVLRSRQNLLRVAERDGKVAGYCAWVRREVLDGEVVAVDVKEACDEKVRDPRDLDQCTRRGYCSSARRAQAPEPCLSVAGYQLLVLGVDEAVQGHGIGGALIRDGLACAARNALPVFVTGEGRGMRVYRHLGFQVLEGTSRSFDRDGNEVDEVGEGGLEAAQMVWVPEGQGVVVKGVVYRGSAVVDAAER